MPKLKSGLVLKEGGRRIILVETIFGSKKYFLIGASNEFVCYDNALARDEDYILRLIDEGWQEDGEIDLNYIFSTRQLSQPSPQLSEEFNLTGGL